MEGSAAITSANTIHAIAMSMTKAKSIAVSVPMHANAKALPLMKASGVVTSAKTKSTSKNKAAGKVAAKASDPVAHLTQAVKWQRKLIEARAGCELKIQLCLREPWLCGSRSLFDYSAR